MGRGFLFLRKSLRISFLGRELGYIVAFQPGFLEETDFLDPFQFALRLCFATALVHDLKKTMNKKDCISVGCPGSHGSI